MLKKGSQINGVKAVNSTPEDVFYHQPTAIYASTEVAHVAWKLDWKPSSKKIEYYVDGQATVNGQTRTGTWQTGEWLIL